MAGGGHEILTLRDVSRSGIPLDTSPVGLETHVWLVAGRYEVRGVRRAHTFAGAFGRSASVKARTPIATLDENGHHVSRLEGRYEYRRAILRDRLARGLVFEGGLAALAAWQTLDSEAPPANHAVTRDVDIGGGAVAGVRLDRWPAVTLEATWTVALVLSRTSEELEAARADRNRRGGGGWWLDRRTGVSVRLDERFWISAFYTTAGQARFASHRGQSDRHGRLDIMVTHVR